MESQILQKESENLAEGIRPNGQGRFWQRDRTEKRQNLEFQGNKSNNQVSKQRKLAFEMATESWAIREEKEEMRPEKYPRIWCVFAREDWAAEMLVSLVGRIELRAGSTLS